MHAANLLWVVIEILLNNLPIRGWDIAVAVLWPLLYSFYTILRVGLTPDTSRCLTEFVSPTCKTDIMQEVMVWPYFFMDTSKGTAVIWYLGLAAFFCLGYYGMFRFWRCTKSGTPPSESTEPEP